MQVIKPFPVMYWHDAAGTLPCDTYFTCWIKLDWLKKKLTDRWNANVEGLIPFTALCWLIQFHQRDGSLRNNSCMSILQAVIHNDIHKYALSKFYV